MVVVDGHPLEQKLITCSARYPYRFNPSANLALHIKLKCPNEKWHISMTVRTHLISLTASDHLSDETGAYSYGLGHQMKPQRIRITHELVMAYGMLEKLHVIVGPADMWASKIET